MLLAVNRRQPTDFTTFRANLQARFSTSCDGQAIQLGSCYQDTRQHASQRKDGGGVEPSIEKNAPKDTYDETGNY